jgi:pimeloyl-ACP methyl ester carboxylesterase
VHLVESTDGVRVPVHDLGGSGPPLLLCHATGFHGLVWGPFASLLAQRFRVWSLDFRGHGDAGPPPALPVDWRGVGDDVLAVVDDLGLEHPFGFGHSMGGAALVLAESDRPGTFRGLSLFEPIVFPVEGPPGGRGNRDLAEGARRRRAVFTSRDEAFANFASKPPLNVFVADALRAYVDHGLADRPEGGVALKCRPEVEAAVYEGAPAHPGWARLAEVRCPATVLTGEHSDVGGELSRLQAERLPGGRVQVVPGVGHFGPMEDPPLLARTVAAALLGD